MSKQTDVFEEKEVDVLIVGGGIAGIAMSAVLMQQCKSFFLVCDNKSFQSASQKAAGLVNPITGKNYVLSWKYPELLEHAIALYGYMAEQIGVDFFQPRTIYRALSDVKQLNDWDFKRVQNGYESYMEVPQPSEEIAESLFCTPNLGPTLQSYQCRIQTLIHQWHTLLEYQGFLIHTIFDHNKLYLSGDKWHFGGIKAGKVVFCEGVHVRNNPYYNYLPIIPNKGEALIVKISGMSASFMIKQQIFIAPWDESKELFWIGSTYQKSEEHALLSDESKTWLLDQLKQTIKLPFTYLGPSVGIRPTVPDRRPMIGQHPDHRNMFILNGLGTKGMSLAPYCAKQTYDLMFQGIAPDPLMDIKRYAVNRQPKSA